MQWLLPLFACVAIVAATGNFTQMVVRVRKTLSVIRVNLATKRVTDTESIVLDIEDTLPLYLDVHFRRNSIVYIEDWTKPKYGDSVRMVALGSRQQQEVESDGTAEGYKTQRVRTMDTTITSVAVDWITNKVYIALETEGSARVEVCEMLEDGLCSVLLYVNVDNLHSLVLDPMDGYMYWLNQIHHRIERAWMDGRHHETNAFHEVGDSNKATTTALAIDHSDRRLYYVRSASSDKSEIWRCDLYHRDSCQRVVEGVNAFFLDVLRNQLYWAPVSNGRGIFTCDKNNCSATVSLIIRSEGMEALRVFDSDSQPLRRSPNPCATDNGGCSHLCLLIAGEPWRSCACPTGVRLREDGKTCAPNGVENALFVAAASGLYYISLDTDDFTPIPVAYKGHNTNEAQKVIAVDYDPVDRFVYWIDGDLSKIRRARVNGSDLSDVITEEVSGKAEALVIDWLGRNLFWLDAVYSRIEVARLDGSSRRTIISTELLQPRGLAIDPLDGYLYFSDWNEKNPRIERAHLDGSNRQVLVRFPENAWPNGLAVDRQSKRLYYAEARSSVIGFVNLLDGRDMTTLADSLNHPYGLSIHGPWLYYSQWRGRIVGRLHLEQRNESRLEVLADSVVAGQMGIKATNLLSPPPGTNQCAVNNGGCSHICLHLPYMRRRCMCPVGYELKVDNATCILPEAFLMFTQNGVKDISRISLHRYPTNLDRLNMQHMDASPQVIDLDQQTQRVYWTSAKHRSEGDCGSIRRAFLNGSKMESLVDEVGVRYLEGLAIDWVAGNLYWSDWEYRRIEVSRLDGSSRRTVVWKNVRPRVIAVNPVDGYIYWANWDGARATMERTQLDGSDASRTSLLSEVGRINAIALDFDRRRIFWSELESLGGRGARISVSDIHGGSRQVLVQENGVVPYAMTYFADLLYFANWPTKTIEVVNATTGSNRTVLHDFLPEITNLVVAHGQKQKGWNECHENNGRCTHLCFARPKIGNNKQSYECSCPDHFDGFPKHSPTDCTPPTSFILVATSGQFTRWKVIESGEALLWDVDPIVVLPLKNVGAAVSIQFDPVTRFIFWIDKEADIIYRARDTDTVATPLALNKKTLCSQPHSLALDVYGRQMFVSCTEKDKKHGAVHVWRMDADGDENKPRTYIGAVVDPTDKSVTGEQPLPRAIAIFPDKNMLFYVDIKHKSTIVRCLLNGRDCRIWQTNNLQTPTELHAALDSSRLFFTTTDGVWSRSVVDAGPSTDQHESIQSRHHLMSSARDKPMTTVGKHLLAVFADSPQTDSVFFFDLSSPTAEFKHGGRPFHLLHKDQKISGLLFVPAVEGNSRPPSQSPCLQSPCSHMCRLVPQERIEGVYQRQETQCLCPLGFSIGQRNAASCFEHVSCSQWQFKCSDGQKCVHSHRVCDGERDCDDESDETNCKFDRHLYSCADGQQSIEREKVCDGIQDCKDKSDESRCRCPEPTRSFDCTGWPKVSDEKENCILRDNICNGRIDCGPGAADELASLCVNKVTGSPKTIETALGVDHVTPLFLVVGCSLVLVVLVVCCLLCYYRRKPPPSINTSTARVIVNPIDGRRDGAVQIEVNAYSGPHYRDRRHWTSDALPPPNSEISELQQYPRSCLTGKSSSSGGRPTSDEFATAGRFYAPPPSAASMSTYGVVKPATLKVRSTPADSHRRSSRPKHKHRRRNGSAHYYEETQLLRTPPPTYSEVQRVTPCSTVVDNGSYYRSQRDVPSTSAQQYDRGAAPPPSPATVRSATHPRQHRSRNRRAPPQLPVRHQQPSSSHSYHLNGARTPLSNRVVLRSSVSSNDSDQVIYENMRARDPPPSPVENSSDS